MGKRAWAPGEPGLESNCHTHLDTEAAKTGVAAWSTRFSLDVDEEQQNVAELPGPIGVAIDPAG